MTIIGLARAQAHYDNMEPPEDAECYCDRWQCEHCEAQYCAPGICTDATCAREAAGPTTLAELDGDYLMESTALSNPDCPAHGGCTCGDDRCRECNG